MIHVYTKPCDFLQKYEVFFKSDEVKYSLIWGISKKDSIVTLMISSEIDGRFIVGVLAGKNLILAANTLEMDVYQELVVYMTDVDYPGIIGLKEHCAIYNMVYSEIYGKHLITAMNQRIYQCTEVNDFSGNTGSVRLAEETDLDLLTEWGISFAEEAEGYTPSKIDTRNNLKEKVLIKSIYLLEVNNQVVSMAGRLRALSNTESIGYVYTPREFRENGYGSQIVETVTQQVLKDGKIATLYTDMSNPTSNSIYTKIGYKPYCDSVMLSK